MVSKPPVTRTSRNSHSSESILEYGLAEEVNEPFAKFEKIPDLVILFIFLLFP